MFGDRPCPACRRILERRENADTAYACASCAREWECCGSCGGVIVEKPRPVDLFTSRVLETFRLCSTCHQEPRKAV